MRKLLPTALLILFATHAVAESQAVLSKEDMDRLNKELLAKAGLSVPDSTEIRIVSANWFLVKSNSRINESNDEAAKEIRGYLAMNREQQKKGFVNSSEPRAKELLEMDKTSLYHKEKYRHALSFKSTHLRGTTEELKLAYTFVGVPEEDMNVKIGVAPYGAYKEVKNGDEADGWDGAVQFFVKNGIGSCAFTEHNRKLARTGVELIKELVTYEVHDKPTVILVKGNEKTGFVYKIEWYDPVFSRELECASPKFSAELRADVIGLANRIESYQQVQ